MTDGIEKYEEFRFPKHRELLGTLESLGPRHPIQVLAEFDVTKARKCLRDYKERTGQGLSFTAWLIKCLAQAVGEDKKVQAYRKGKKLIVFEDVDVGFTIERESGSEGMIVGSIIRKANEKTVLQIHDEVRAAQGEKATHGVIVGEKEEARLAGRFQSVPGFVRRIMVSRYRRDPFVRKRTQGTVGISSVGNVVGESQGFSGFPLGSGPYPLWLTVGNISRKLGLVDGKAEACDYLPANVVFDHDVIDGADATRFLARLGELLAEAYGLESQSEESRVTFPKE